ncbi:hypothetical protein ABMY26_07150 (plasmid) [Azospirillum sp. HJ39]|uniref:hypothetical protein n=1 Tax=Azospirillum sp. HJ39 TaxID=3159496 RepID=UPI003556F35F
MTPELTRLIEAADEAVQAMQAMLTTQPFQMTERSERLGKAHRELAELSRAAGIDAGRRAPSQPAQDSLTETAKRIAWAVHGTAAGVKDVFDAHDGPTGLWDALSTAERESHLSAARATQPVGEVVVDGWKPISEAPQNVMIDVRSTTTCTYRWRAYRPGSPQLQRGNKGRWQRATDYGWENAHLPENGEWKPVEITRAAAIRGRGEG